MGPRPFGRGRRQRDRGRCRAAGRRQWGRDRLAAEGDDGQVGTEADSRASMGPRPFGRGRVSALAQQAMGNLASMGPRPFGRGRLVQQNVQRLHLAASMGPRPFGRGRSAPPAPPPHRPHASMGPRPFGRGRTVIAECEVAAKMRQWGRDRLAAEGGSGKTRTAPTRCVNGAATVWPRKDFDVPDDVDAG